ncbi:MAG: hypothetical protein JOZ15_22440 [Acidobacteria bacterium]|nr:hypothetical protein [Acidobacteriota bacterium]
MNDPRLVSPLSRLNLMHSLLGAEKPTAPQRAVLRKPGATTARHDDLLESKGFIAAGAGAAAVAAAASSNHLDARDPGF